MKPVTAVIVSYQSARTIGATLAAARRCHEAGLLELVVVDNDSRDATRAILAREAGWARVVLSAQNLGFARGCNLGAAHLQSPYALFLNPDAVLEPEALRRLLEFMERHPRAGIAGPAITCGADAAVLQHAGPLPTPWSLLREALPYAGPPRSVGIAPGAAPFRAGWVCGAVLMIRSSLLARLHGFDPRFFLYWEETDLCRRAQDAGFEVWAVGAALAHHAVAASSAGGAARVGSALARHYFQSRYYYMLKHHGWAAATLAELGEFLLLGARCAADLARGRGLQRLRPRLQAALLSRPERLT